MRNRYLNIAKNSRAPVDSVLFRFESETRDDSHALRLLAYLHARLPFEHPGRWPLERAGLSIAREIFVNSLRAEAALHALEQESHAATS